VRSFIICILDGIIIRMINPEGWDSWERIEHGGD
jgi:hypothetical protein